MKVLRLIGFVVIAIAAVAVVFAASDGTVSHRPSLSGGASTRSDVSTALSDWKTNEAGSDTAPQQTVSGVWAVKDLGAIQSRATAHVLDNQVALDERQPGPDDRLVWLVALAIIAICWHGATVKYQTASPAKVTAAGDGSGSGFGAPGRVEHDPPTTTPAPTLPAHEA